MEQITQPRSGQYTASLLGTIRSNLAGLQGYDVMALELIQNADDAKAKEIVFDITDNGLWVRNSSQFTYCGNLHKPCTFSKNGNQCDYHHIVKVASGGKLSRSDNIGRFGIGFVSTYQVTDRPEIRSAGIKLTLRPEKGKWFLDPCDDSDTSFFLPWADDPNTEARRELGVSPVNSDHIAQLTVDFQTVLRQSLLFLHHVRKAQVRRNGELLLACDLDRSIGSDLIVSFRPSGKTECWHILRADAADAAKRLCEKHSGLESLGRSTKISIGLPIEPKMIAEGLLYAFLPTKQPTGLPLHINADFFPEPDRKAAIFDGHQHQQEWNEMLIDAAAAELVRDLEGLLKILGHIQLWQLLKKMYDLFFSTKHPPCFKHFWERLQTTAAQAHIALAQDDSVQRPNDLLLPSQPLDTDQVTALLEVGGNLVTEELRPFWTVMSKLGAPQLTLGRLVDLLEPAMAHQVSDKTKVDENRLKHFYRPLWRIINDLLPESGVPNPSTNSAVQRLRALPFVVTADLFAVTINQSYAVLTTLDANRTAVLLPKLDIASHHLLEFQKINALINSFELSTVVLHIREPIEEVISVEQKDLQYLYVLLADLSCQSSVEDVVYQQLRDLPIWKSSHGLIKATQALLPGDFTDPTGQAGLLDTSVLTESVKHFLSDKLRVEKQTIKTFVQTVLPRFFDNDSPLLDKEKYARLISELAAHSTLLDDEDIKRLLGGLPLLPTQNGSWSSPLDTYRRTDKLVKELGDSPHLWLDDNRIPATPSVYTFISNLGIRQSPIARHLVDRMLSIAETPPTEDAKRASSEAFYVLCDNYEQWKEKSFFQDAIDKLRQSACFPAEGDTDNWHTADSLYAPYRADAFRSQANILEFRHTGHLETELLKKLSITIKPETELVIKHLQYCIEMDVQPHIFTYQILNERAQESDPLVSTLDSSRCIYVEHKFVRPNQLYWAPQQLGRYAFTIPIRLGQFKPLFDAIGVKNAPEGRDFVKILLEDIVDEYFKQSKPLVGLDQSIYYHCLSCISSAHKQQKLIPADLQCLRKAPTILNLSNQLNYPDEVLLQDSEWYASFFKGELDQSLCKPAPELWPFIEEIGVKSLSKSTQVTLEYKGCSQADENWFAEKLMGKIDILTRLLYTKPTTVRKKIRDTLSEFKAISLEVVRIQVSVNIEGNPRPVPPAPPAPASAFFDFKKSQLILARPVDNRAQVLRVLFHQLMPEETGNEISKLAMLVDLLMEKTIEEAHHYLTGMGTPCLDVGAEAEESGDRTSPILDEMGATTETNSRDEGEISSVSDKDAEKSDAAQDREDFAQTHASKPSDQSEHAIGSEQGAALGELRTRNPRPKYKQQWDRRLLSYVKQNEPAETDKQDNSSEHNRAVEIASRSAVCDYERDRGRIAEQMAQMNPGYDIISLNPTTQEERFIEVKGIYGEWNRTGVGLSRVQFSNAQNEGDRYWLYVVEFAFDPERQRIHPICNPAMKVTSFMFDGNWQDASTEEHADPCARFIPGIRIHHQDLGLGEILEITSRGDTKLLKIKFDDRTQDTPNVRLNLHRMYILEDPEDADDDNHF